jgi:toxin ParE1/3/4
MELIWLPESRDDIQRLFDFLVDVNPAAAERAVRVIQTGARQLREHPEIGRPMDDDAHRRELFLPFGANAYVLRYRIVAQAIVVLRVWHGREHRD